MVLIHMPYMQRIKGDMAKEMAIKEKDNMETITKGKVPMVEIKPKLEIWVTGNHTPNKEEVTINHEISIETDFLHGETD